MSGKLYDHEKYCKQSCIVYDLSNEKDRDWKQTIMVENIRSFAKVLWPFTDEMTESLWSYFQFNDRIFSAYHKLHIICCISYTAYHILHIICCIWFYSFKILRSYTLAHHVLSVERSYTVCLGIVYFTIKKRKFW